MRVLITGAGGFVGPHLVEALRSHLPADARITPAAPEESDHASLGRLAGLDVTDRDQTFETIARMQCTHVVHLAGLSAVPAANSDPGLAWRVNLHGTLNVADAIMAGAPDCVFLFIGSGQIYGPTGADGRPHTEESLLAPADEYSVSKSAADLAVRAKALRGLRCLRFRPFNHTGPGQRDDFVVASLALQIARIAAGKQEPVLRVGNLEAVRDFLDVRDVALAYTLGVLKSGQLPNGIAINVSSGHGVKVRDVLGRLCALSGIDIRIEQDPARMRPSDLPAVIGDSTKARSLLSWTPQYDLDRTLSDLLADCIERVGSR
jgi:GDP-4-dehydro-6-deoxy-D-mannose reductase